MAIIPTTSDLNVDRDAEILGRVIKIIDSFASTADAKESGFIAVHGDRIVADTWNASWGSINEAAGVVDRLASIFEDAGFSFRIKDQPTGPARASGGGRLMWDNRPELTVMMPTGKGAESAVQRLETVAEMTAKYRLPARKFTAHSL